MWNVYILLSSLSKAERANHLGIGIYFILFLFRNKALSTCSFTILPTMSSFDWLVVLLINLDDEKCCVCVFVMNDKKREKKRAD
jgi:hypothetical protein